MAAIVARARNGAIGRNGDLPWRLSSDLKRFKALTMGKPLLMGRRTFASLPGALPGRANLVVTRDAAFRGEGAWALSSIETLVAAGRAMAQARGVTEVCVIGGADLFEALRGEIDRFYLTEVEAEVAGDVFMPAPGPDFVEVAREDVPAGPRDDHSSVFRILDRARRTA